MRKLALSGLSLAIALLATVGPAEAGHWFGGGCRSGGSRGCGLFGGRSHSAPCSSSSGCFVGHSCGAACGSSATTCSSGGAVTSDGGSCNPCSSAGVCTSGSSGACASVSSGACTGAGLCVDGSTSSSVAHVSACKGCRPWWRRTAACYQRCSPSTCASCGGYICNGPNCGGVVAPEGPARGAPSIEGEPPAPTDDVPPPPQA